MAIIKESEKNGERKREKKQFIQSNCTSTYLFNVFATLKSCRPANAVAQCSTSSPLYVFTEKKISAAVFSYSQRRNDSFLIQIF